MEPGIAIAGSFLFLKFDLGFSYVTRPVLEEEPSFFRRFYRTAEKNEVPRGNRALQEPVRLEPGRFSFSVVGHCRSFCV